ncbi:hypothetical protein ACFY2K_26340 [Kitasatospora sp. NPDC001309]|uniref:hypothetical protein n=1 Tax=Kitasatospora sp. NPDC001309 TaxID=3364013 RepID=UPI0036CE32FC
MAYYHGTASEIIDGEVSPLYSGRNWRYISGDYAYATSSVERAWFYAENAWHMGGDFPRVYEVEPLGNDCEMDPQDAANGVRSSTGFRIVSGVPWSEERGPKAKWERPPVSIRLIEFMED